MTLTDLVAGPGGIQEVAAFLAPLSVEDRIQALWTLSKAGQRTLYQKAEASRPVVSTDLVHPDEGVPVEHKGRNSLWFFRDFSKHMVLRDGVVWGYNESPTRWWVGPGYFWGREAEPACRAAWLVDYWRVPKQVPVSGWPSVRPNSRGLSWFVYHKTRDHLRVVTDGVLIGSAQKTLFGRERSLDSYFLLVRV